jgi:hypothetical protein
MAMTRPNDGRDEYGVFYNREPEQVFGLPQPAAPQTIDPLMTSERVDRLERLLDDAGLAFNGVPWRVHAAALKATDELKARTAPIIIPEAARAAGGVYPVALAPSPDHLKWACAPCRQSGFAAASRAVNCSWCHGKGWQNPEERAAYDKARGL